MRCTSVHLFMLMLAMAVAPPVAPFTAIGGLLAGIAIDGMM
jgi:hypothetical protein